MRNIGSIMVRLCLLLGFIAQAAGASVPPGTSIDNQASASYQASSGTATSANSNVVHVIAQAPATGALLAISKSASKVTANPGDQITYTLNVTNSGTGDAVPVAVTIDGSAANKIIIRYVVPSNSVFSGFVIAGVSTPLYHIFSAPLQT